MNSFKNFLIEIAPDAISALFGMIHTFALMLSIGFFDIYLTLGQAALAGFAYGFMSIAAKFLATAIIQQLKLEVI